MAYSDPITGGISGRAARSRLAKAHIHELVLDLERATPREPSPQSREYLARVAAVLSALESAWQHAPDDSFKQFALSVESILEAGMNGYMRLAAEVGLTSAEKARRGSVAALLGDALCTIRIGIPGVDTVADLSSLAGSANCASTAGGTAPSLHRNTNVLDKVWAANASTAGLKLSSLALAHIAALRVDPLAAPDAAGVTSALYDVARGVSYPA